MQIKTIVRENLTAVRTANYQNIQTISVAEDGERLESAGNEKRWDTIEKSTAGPRRIKTRTTVQSSPSSPGCLSKRIEIRIVNRYLHPHVHCSIFTTAKTANNPCPSTGEWRQKMYIHKMESYSAIKGRKEGKPWRTSC